MVVSEFLKRIPFSLRSDGPKEYLTSLKKSLMEKDAPLKKPGTSSL
jgi:hypothetical protein